MSATERTAPPRFAKRAVGFITENQKRRERQQTKQLLRDGEYDAVPLRQTRRVSWHWTCCIGDLRW